MLQELLHAHQVPVHLLLGVPAEQRGGGLVLLSKPEQE